MEKEIVLVTGGGTGIGQAICEQLANPDRHIYIHYGGSQQGAEQTLSLVEAQGGSGEIIQADLNDSTQITAMIQKIPGLLKTVWQFGCLIKCMTM
jgi:3-oxoacyl-[acyl-carrier protein] reductase